MPLPRAAPEQQVERLGEQRLAGAGLAREHVQARATGEARPGPAAADSRRAARAAWRPVYQAAADGPAWGPRDELRHARRASEPSRRRRQAPELLAQALVERRARRPARGSLVVDEPRLDCSPGASTHTGRPSTVTSTGSSRERLWTRQHVGRRHHQRPRGQRVRRDERDHEPLHAPGHHRAAVGEVVAGRPGRAWRPPGRRSAPGRPRRRRPHMRGPRPGCRAGGASRRR